MAIVTDYTSIYTPYHWTQFGSDGQPGFVTYSFDTTGSTLDYLAGEGFSQNFIDSISRLTDTQINYARSAIQDWDAASGLRFLEVPAGQGDIRITLADFTSMPGFNLSGAFGFWPYVDITSSTAYADQGIGGDVFINATSADYQTRTPSQWLGLMRHEIGHAIGLDHPHEQIDSNLAAASVDNQFHTIMSYNGNYTAGLGPFDVQAVQQAHGTTDGAHLLSWSWNALTQTLTQTDGNDADTLIGVGVRDVINGLGGNDRIAGFGGNDLLDGGHGNDVVFGGTGNDTLIGGAGDDRLSGGNSDFTPTTNAGTDTADYSSSNQPVTINLASVSWSGTGYYHATGNDIGFDFLTDIDNVIGGSAGDTISADNTANLLFGRSGGDVLKGRAGNDTIYGQSGNDTLEGGAGADSLVGGWGSDYASYAAAASGVSVSLGAGGPSRGEAVGDDFISIENISGSSYNDFLVGDGQNNAVAGLVGNDKLHGGAGVDTVDGGAGRDTLRGLDGNDLAYGGAGNDTVFGDAGDDTLFGDAGADFMVGGLGADELHGGAGDDTLSGRSAADTMSGGTGNDIVQGDSHNDSISGGAGNDFVNAVGGNDTLKGDAGDDTLKGGTGSDLLRGGTGNDVLEAGAGADTFVFATNDGADRIKDWQPGIDIIDFSGNSNYNSFADVAAAMTDLSNGHLRIQADANDQILILATSSSDLASGYFVF